jgi:hypothetical protein
MRLALDTPDAGLGRWLAGQTAQLAEMIRRATARDVIVEIDTSALKGADGPQEVRRKIEEAQQSPLVRRAMEIFDATVVEVQEEPATQPPADAAGSTEHV